MAFQKSTQELLDKYWAAETTPEEEAQLRTVMQGTDRNVFTEYFRFLDAESAVEMSAPLAPVRQARRVGLQRTISIAAAVLVLVAAGFIIQRSMLSDVTHTTADSYDDPKEAYEEAKQALLLVSEKLNKSRIKAGAELEKAQPYIEIIK